MALLTLAGCSKAPEAAQSSADPSGVVVDRNEETGINRVDFTNAARAAERLGIQTSTVGTMDGPAGTASVPTVPYAAVLYAATGQALVYTNPEPLVFVSHPITIDRIEGETAVLTAGPPAGTAVVTTGAAELTGIEFGVGK